MVFVNFWLNQIQNCSVQIKKMKDGIFISFQLKKNASPKRLQKMLDWKIYPLSLIWLESYNKRNDRRKFPKK